jgi:hypothetical protein
LPYQKAPGARARGFLFSVRRRNKKTGGNYWRDVAVRNNIRNHYQPLIISNLWRCLKVPHLIPDTSNQKR